MALAAGQQKMTSEIQNKQEKDQSILGMLSAFLLILFSYFSMNPGDTNRSCGFYSFIIPNKKERVV